MDQFALLQNSQGLEGNPANPKRIKISPQRGPELGGSGTSLPPGHFSDGKSKVSFSLEKNLTHLMPEDSHPAAQAHEINPAAAQAKVNETLEVLRQIADTINESHSSAQYLLRGNGLFDLGPRPVDVKVSIALESTKPTYAAAHVATLAASHIVAIHPQLACAIAELSTSVARVAEDVAQTAVSVLETLARQSWQTSTTTKIRQARVAVKATGAELRTAHQLMLKINAAVGTHIDPTSQKVIPATECVSKAYKEAHHANKHLRAGYNEALAFVKPLEDSRRLNKQKQLAALALQPVLQKLEQQQKKSEMLLHIPANAAAMQTVRQVGHLLDDSESDVSMPDRSEP